MVQQAAQRMTPVDVVMCIRLRTLPVFLQDFVGKQENHQNERNHQKRAQYYVFDHDNLLVVKRLHNYCSRHATDCTWANTHLRRRRPRIAHARHALARRAQPCWSSPIM